MAKVKTDTDGEVWDSIVIGSGIGGLSCASLLAQCQTNHRVLVLEQHPDHAGGCVGSFERDGYPFMIGVHYLDDMGEPDPDRPPTVKQMIDALCMEGDPIECTRMPDQCLSLMIGKDNLQVFDIDITQIEESLIRLFPNEKKHIQEYTRKSMGAIEAWDRAMMFKALPRGLVSFLLATGLHRWLDKGFHKLAQQSVEEMVTAVTDDADLRCILECVGSEAGVPPNDYSFLFQAIICNMLGGGLYYPSGGAGQIPKKICQAIEACGGEIRVNTKVNSILIERKRAVGVELVSGQKIRAKQVISDAGLINTFHNMVPTEYHPTLVQKIPPSLEAGLTGAMLFVGLKGDADEDFNLSEKTVVVLPSNDLQAIFDTEPKTWDALQAMKAEELNILISPLSTRDGDWKKNYPGKTTLQILAFNIPWKPFADMLDSNGEVLQEKQAEYQTFKIKLSKMIWSRARKALIASGASNKLPESIDHVDFSQVGTPLTFARYLGRHQGSWFGLNQNRERFSPQTFYLDLRPDCPSLPGLYLTGQDVMMFGVGGAMFGGYSCAGNLIGEANPFNLLKMVNKNRAVPPKN